MIFFSVCCTYLKISYTNLFKRCSIKGFHCFQFYFTGEEIEYHFFNFQFIQKEL